MIKATFMNIEKEEKMVGWGESVVLDIPIELIRPPVYGQKIKFLVNASELYKCQENITKWSNYSKKYQRKKGTRL